MYVKYNAFTLFKHDNNFWENIWVDINTSLQITHFKCIIYILTFFFGESDQIMFADCQGKTDHG